MRKRIIGSEIKALLKVDSTNVYARVLISKEKPQEGTVIVAGEQRKGKGHGANIWQSQRGKNLLFSIILYPDFISATTQFLLSKVISLGIYDYLCGYISDVSIKWPNDIYVDDRKIAGIRIENDLLGAFVKNSIVGIGLNMNQENFPKGIPNPVSLTQMIEKQLVLRDEMIKVCRFLDKRYKMLAKGMVDKIRRDYHNTLFRLNEMAWYQNNASKFRAKIIGVSDYGQLILENQSGKTLEYNFKEVDFIL